MKSLGQIAFEAWRAAVNRELIEHGEPRRLHVRTEFDDLTCVLQSAWEAAAVAVTQQTSPVVH
jgi:hypothetical protein